MKCFVVMPYGKKRDRDNREINFDTVYAEIIKPAVERSGLECIRSDHIASSGQIHRDMFNHLLSDEFTIVDLSTFNPNVLYELGVRHMARRSVTIVIVRKGSTLPFNISAHRTLEYDPFNKKTFADAQQRLFDFIQNGLARPDLNDSPIYDSIADVMVRRTSPPIAGQVIYESRLIAHGERSIRIFGGDIKNAARIAQVWVNPENTLMQMARPYDRAISASLRFHGARKDANKQILEDAIADDLAAKMRERGTLIVPPAEVIVTTSGELAATHGVDEIFHVACVHGSVGGGYVPVHDLDACADNVLATFEERAATRPQMNALLFPLMGAGTGQGAAEKSALTIARAAIRVMQRPDARLQRLYVLAFTEEELRACVQVLTSIPEIEDPAKLK